MKIFKYIGFGILGIGFVILAIWLTMSLWNWLIPVLFHGPVITFWQTAGLFILSRILLAGVSHRCRSYRQVRWPVATEVLQQIPSHRGTAGGRGRELIIR